MGTIPSQPTSLPSARSWPPASRRAQAAARLGGVTQVRVRQLIADGTLYAVRIDGRWKIPVFQFQPDGLVPNIGVVNAVVPRTLDAVSVVRWYTTPDDELETPDGHPLSPLAWLQGGRNPAPGHGETRDRARQSVTLRATVTSRAIA